METKQRKLKFRAWDDHAKKWLCGYGYPSIGGFSMFGEVMMMGEWSEIITRFILNQYDRKPEDLVVEQYTGLQDKNGREIYEGDIVRNGGFICTVDYEAGAFQLVAIETLDEGCWDLLFDLCRCGQLGLVEVIGNVHENPELLQP